MLFSVKLGMAVQVWEGELFNSLCQANPLLARVLPRSLGLSVIVPHSAQERGFL